MRKQALSEKVTVNYNIVADIGEIQKLTAQAAGIGNNLNQIARYFHGGGLASHGMLEELKKCIAEIRELRQEIVQLAYVQEHGYDSRENLSETADAIYTKMAKARGDAKLTESKRTITLLVRLMLSAFFGRAIV